MPTEALVFDRSTTGRAERMAKEGIQGTYILRDQGAQGLSLRIENNTASWIVRYKNFTRTIGVLSPRPNSMELSGFTTARNLAADVRRVLKTNPSQAKEYIKLRHLGNNHDEAVAGLREEQTTWTLRECLEKTIEVRSNASAEDAWSPNTKRDYEYVFGLHEWRKTLDQPCVEITSRDIERVRDELNKSGRTSTANKVIAYTRSVYNFCSGNFSGDSGLNKVAPWWKQLRSPYKIPPKQRTPAIEEIVKTLILAEQYLTKPLPGRKSSSPGTDARTLSGLWWIALTAQRANAGVSLRTHDIIQDESDKSWYLAAWSAEDMKARRSFILPVPKRAWDHINMFRSISTPRLASEWAFPSVRGTQKHVSASGVYRILYRLAGRDEKTVRKWRTSGNKARSGGRKPGTTSVRDMSPNRMPLQKTMVSLGWPRTFFSTLKRMPHDRSTKTAP